MIKFPHLQTDSKYLITVKWNSICASAETVKHICASAETVKFYTSVGHHCHLRKDLNQESENTRNTFFEILKKVGFSNALYIEMKHSENKIGRYSFTNLLLKIVGE